MEHSCNSDAIRKGDFYEKVQKYFYCFLSILCLCILKFSLSGCSEIKDGIVGTSAGGGKPEGEAPKSDVSITTERTKQIGDVCELRTMSDNDFDTSTVRWKCIVQKAKLYDKPSDAGIDTSRIITSSTIKVRRCLYVLMQVWRQIA